MSGFIKKGGAGSVNVEQIEGLEAYDITKTYALGNNVKESGRIWESLKDNNLGHIPSADNELAPVWWKEISATHLPNTDSKLKRTNGSFIHADNIPTAFVQSSIYYISPNGNDATGVKGREDLPFQTIKAVYDRLENNDRIVIMPGSYGVGSDAITNAIGIHIHLISATIHGNLYLPGGNGTYTSDGNGVINGSVGILGVDYTKYYYVRNLKKCSLGRGRLWVDGVEHLADVSDANMMYIHNVQKCTAYFGNQGLMELVNVREVSPQTSFWGLRYAYIKGCRFFTDVANGTNFSSLGNYLQTPDALIFRDCEFVSNGGHNFQITLEDIANVYAKFINCRFYSGSTFHLDAALHWSGNFPTSRLHLTFIGCDFNRIPFIKSTASAFTTIKNQITQDLLDDTVDVTYKGLGLATTVNIATSAFVSTGGDDVKAIKGRIDRPYKTIQAAVHSNAQVIVVLGGTYTEQVNITSDNGADRLFLLFGAVLTSNAAYTMQIGKGNFHIIGAGVTSAMYNTGMLQNYSAVINTLATGVTLIKGGNPGAVPLHLENVMIKSEGSNAAAACFYEFQAIMIRNCRIHAAKQCWKGSYGISYTVEAYNSTFTAMDFIVNCIDPNSVLGGFFDNCKFKAGNGFSLGTNPLKTIQFNNCEIEATIGYGINIIPGYASVPIVKLLNTSIKAITKCYNGSVFKLEVEGGVMHSTIDFPFNIQLQSYAGAIAEFRNTKLLAEAAQTNAIVNAVATNPGGQTLNTGVNLINVSMNKAIHANVNGILHNVLINAALTAI